MIPEDRMKAQIAELNARRDLWKAIAKAIEALVALAQQAAAGR